MAGNRKNAVDDLAAGFLSTRPAAFDNFLLQPKITIPAESTVNGQSVTDTEELIEQTGLTQESAPVANEAKGEEALINKLPDTILTDIVKSKRNDLTESSTLLKRVASPLGKSKKAVSSYEELFLGKSRQLPSDQGDKRLYIKRSYVRLLTKLVLYCEHKDQSMSLQAILDNILHHHFEQYATEIREIDVHLLNLLSQRVND